MQCITTLTTGVMFIKHLPHSCVSLNVICKMQNLMNLDGIFKPLIHLFRIYLLSCCVVELWLNIFVLCFLSIIQTLVSVLPAIMNICRISRGNRGLCIAVEFFNKKTVVRPSIFK